MSNSKAGLVILIGYTVISFMVVTMTYLEWKKLKPSYMCQSNDVAFVAVCLFFSPGSVILGTILSINFIFNRALQDVSSVVSHNRQKKISN